MPVNPRATLLIKPGDPSDVYQIGKPRYLAGGGVEQTVPTDPIIGDDVTQWQSVMHCIYSDYDNVGFQGAGPFPSMYTVVWRYYDSASPVVRPGVGGVGSVATYTARGTWIRGESMWLTIGCAQNQQVCPNPSYVICPTYNCDRMYFQHDAYANYPVGGLWVGLALYGVTPRTSDGTISAVQGIGGGGGGLSNWMDDTRADVAVATGAGAIALAIPAIGQTDYELIGVLCHFSAAPAIAGNFTVTLNVSGVEYDTLLYSVDPSVMGLTNILYLPKTRLNFTAFGGFNVGLVTVTYANPSAVTYGCQILYRTQLSA